MVSAGSEEDRPNLSVEDGRSPAEAKINDEQRFGGEMRKEGGWRGGRKTEMNGFALPFLASRRH